MARPLRIEYGGALYLITARGNARGDIYSDNKDRTLFLALLRNICASFLTHHRFLFRLTMS